MKKIILAAAVIVVLIITGNVIYNYAVPDYVKYDEVLKGYTDCDGYDNSGKDIDIYYAYSYTEKQIDDFAQNDLYTIVDDSNIEEVKEMIGWYEQFNEHEKFSDTVSNGDYFVLKYLDHNGNEMEYFDDYFSLYFFDCESCTLHYLRQSM
ncbi:MAG: hypothetical protein NC397_10020 [Clostridium sp.]|nr:hypothetical protein [Clostridium sp.]